MKFRRVKGRRKGISITLTFESEEELQDLWFRLNTDRNSVIQSNAWHETINQLSLVSPLWAPLTNLCNQLNCKPKCPKILKNTSSTRTPST